MAWKPDYVSVPQLADYLRVPDNDDAIQMGWAVTAASRAVDQATSRQFGKDAAPVARYYTPAWDGRRRRWVVGIDDVQNLTGLAVDYDSTGDLTFATSITDYRLMPLNAAANGRPYTELMVQNLAFTNLLPGCIGGFTGDFTRLREGTVRVTGTFGWTLVPDEVIQATLIQASRFLMRRDSPFGVAGAATDGNVPLRLHSRVDPDVAVILSTVKRWWGAA